MVCRYLALVAALLCLPLASATATGKTTDRANKKGRARSPWRVEVKGARAPDAVIRVIRRRRGPFLACLARTMRKHKLGALGGKLAARFVIDRAGAVRAVQKVKSSFKRAEVDRCLLGQIKRLRFSPAGGETRVYYTWQLERII